MTMQVCRKRLGITWIIGAMVLVIVLILQTMRGLYGDKANEAWGWFIPTVFPTLALILAVLVSDFKKASVQQNRTVDLFMYRLTLGLSILYLLVVSSTILLRPLFSWAPLELMRLSNLWLGPLQGIVAAVIGVFFVGK